MPSDMMIAFTEWSNSEDGEREGNERDESRKMEASI